MPFVNMPLMLEKLLKYIPLEVGATDFEKLINDRQYIVRTPETAQADGSEEGYYGLEAPGARSSSELTLTGCI